MRFLHVKFIADFRTMLMACSGHQFGLCRRFTYRTIIPPTMELADSIKHLNFYAIRFSRVSPICEIVNVCCSSDLNSGTRWALLEMFFCIESEDIIALIFHVKISMSLSFQTYS